MELSPARQKLLFTGIVVVLAVLGYYLVMPALRHTPARPAATASTSAPAPAPSSAVQPAPPEQSAAAVNIYSWLPFTQAGLAAAAQVTTRFGAAYDTYSYTDTADAYLGRMSGLITVQLAATVRNGFTPGVAKLWTSEQLVSTGTATITGLRAFGPDSLTFIVALAQRMQTSKGTSSATTRYAVTVVGSGTGWQVNDIELQNAGNA